MTTMQWLTLGERIYAAMGVPFVGIDHLCLDHPGSDRSTERSSDTPPPDDATAPRLPVPATSGDPRGTLR